MLKEKGNDKDTEKGFTLIESVLSLALFMMFSLTLISFFLQSSQDSSTVDQRLSAVYLANLTLKHYQSEGFEALASKIALDPPVYSESPQLSVILPSGYNSSTDMNSFTDRISLSYSDDPELDTAINQRIIMITVDIYWDKKHVETTGSVKR